MDVAVALLLFVIVGFIVAEVVYLIARRAVRDGTRQAREDHDQNRRAEVKL